MNEFGVSTKDVVETTLADLSVQQVSERLPALFNHYLGFELIEKNDEGTRAAGLLGFDIGGRMFYVPTLFLNGRIKGTEMIYSKDSDLFVPGTKQWVDELINNAQAIIGESANYSPKGQVGLGQLQIFREPQMGGAKSAGFHDLRELTSKPYRQNDLDVVRFFKMAGFDVYRRFMKYAMYKRPELLQALCNIYHPDDIKIAEFEELEAEETAASIIDTPPVSDTATLKVIIDPADKEAKSLGLEDKTKLMQTGIAIVDTRNSDEKPFELNTQETENFSSPDSTGVYEMLGKDLEFNRVIIGVKPSPVEAFEWHAPGFVIIDPDSGLCYYESGKPGSGNLARVTPVVKEVDSNRTEIVDFGGGTSPLSSVSIGKVYVLVRKDGSSISMPFRVSNKADGKFRAESEERFYDLVSWDNHFPIAVPDQLSSRGEVQGKDRGVWIEEFKSGGFKPYMSDNNLFLPGGQFGVREVIPANSCCCCGLAPWDPSEKPAKTEAEREARREEMEKRDQERKTNEMKVMPAYQNEVNVAVVSANRGTLKVAGFLLENSRGFLNSVELKIAGKAMNPLDLGGLSEEEYYALMAKAIPENDWSRDDPWIGWMGSPTYRKWKTRLKALDKSGHKPKPEQIGGGYFHPSTVQDVLDFETKSLANKGEEKVAAFPIKVRREGGDYKVTFGDKTASLRGKVNLIATLVKNVNLGEEDARKIADDAESYKSVTKTFVFPKTAREIPNAAIDIPWPDIDDSTGSTPYSGTPEVSPVRGIVQGEHEQYDYEDPFNPEIADYNQIMQKAMGDQQGFIERAGQSGVKQVFDPAMIGILLKTNRVQLQVESEFLPALVRGVDRMCRLLLTFYWHNAEFAENYGQEKLAEFEDVLLSTIKDAGQCVLFLKQKAVGGKNLDAFAETA